MPTYDYQCRSCGHTIEVIHSMLEEGPTTCERCGGSLRRVLYPTGIIFKGSGFYKTDSRTSGSASDSGTPKPPPSGEKPPGDKKPAATGEAASVGGGSESGPTSSSPSTAKPEAAGS